MYLYLVEYEVVVLLRLAGLLGDIGDGAPAEHHVDEAGLSDVGSADESHLRYRVGGQRGD